MPEATSIADWGQPAAGWESPNPKRLQEFPAGGGCSITDAMLACMLQIGCLQNESVGFEQCLRIESTHAGDDPNLLALGRVHGTL